MDDPQPNATRKPTVEDLKALNDNIRRAERR